MTRRLGQHAYTRPSGLLDEKELWGAEIVHKKIHAGMPVRGALESYGSNRLSKATKDQMAADHEPLDHSHYGME